MSRAFDLVAPNVPAFGRLTGKKLHAGKVSHEPNNALPRFIRLFGMLFDVAEKYENGNFVTADYALMQNGFT